MAKIALVITMSCLSWLVASTAAADEFVIRVERSGFNAVPKTINQPTEVVDCALELQCRPEELASCKVQFGNETVTLIATLHRVNATKFKVEFQIREALDTGDAYIDVTGGRTKRVDKTDMKSQATLLLSQTVDVGGLLSEKTDGKAVLKSKRFWRLSVHSYQPPPDEE